MQPLVKRCLLVFTLFIFAIGLFLSIKTNPGLLAELSWPYIVALMVFGAPLIMLANSLDIFVTARAVGSTMSMLSCIRTSILSTASNILPVPGGAMVRIAALSTAGTPVKNASVVTLVSGVIWLATATCVASVAFINVDFWLAIVTGVIGAVSAVAAYCAALKIKITPQSFLGFVGVKLMIVTIESLRYYWALKALGVDPGFVQAVIIALAAVIGSIVAIAPAGIGVREASAAALAMSVAISPGAGFLSSVLNRVTMYATLIVIVAGAAAGDLLQNPSGKKGSKGS